MFNDEKGWIKIHRKILDNPICTKDPEYFSIWSYLLLKATHAPYMTFFRGNKITLQPGQLLTGRKSIAEFWGISESKVQRVLKSFENEGQLSQETSSQNRLITIKNWDQYQLQESKLSSCDEVLFQKTSKSRQQIEQQKMINCDDTDNVYDDMKNKIEQQNEQPVNNRWTTGEQPVNTNKNIKNIRNKEYISKGTEKSSVNILSSEKLADELAETLDMDLTVVQRELVIMIDWLKSKGKRYKDYKAFARNWLRKTKQNTSTVQKKAVVIN